MATLTYYIYEGVLIGTAGGETVHMFAGSGGGAGSTARKGKVAAPKTAVANNPYAWHVKAGSGGYGQDRGGPLPPGQYKIATPGKHEKLGRSARLDPGGALVNNRGGFYIHGQGPHGSDGCLVLGGEDLSRILSLLTKDKGGMLYCCEAMGGVRFA